MNAWWMTAILALTTEAVFAQVYGTRPDGKAITELAPASAQTVVLYFVATDCPVSNRTFPEMRRVREEFAARGVAFRYVYPNLGESPQGVRRHQAEFDAAGEALLDDHGVLTRMTHARVTPEAVVLRRTGAQWATVYEGRVDDRYVRLGLERPAAQNHFVERVVDEVLAGRAVEPAVGTPVGCAIMRPGETVQR